MRNRPLKKGIAKAPRAKRAPVKSQAEKPGASAPFQGLAAYHSGLWKIRLPSKSSPLRQEEGLKIPGPKEHAVFLRSCELYRVIELNVRLLPALIEAYSRYRARDHFRDSFSFRYFDADLALLAPCDPELIARQSALFDILHELRVSLAYTDALPHTTQAEIESVLHCLAREWNILRDRLFERFGWDFKSIEIS